MPIHTADADATVELSRVGVGRVGYIGLDRISFYYTVCNIYRADSDAFRVCRDLV